MVKVILSSLENLRGIVRQAAPRKRVNSVVTEKSKSRDKADSSSKIFKLNKVALFHFLLLHITPETMRVGDLRELSCRSATKGNAGANATTSASVAKCA